MKKTISALLLAVAGASSFGQVVLAVAGAAPGGKTDPLKSGSITACSYEDKSYSEGAIRATGKFLLVCVERDWGYKEYSAARNLVREPITSSRLEIYRKATGLSTK